MLKIYCDGGARGNPGPAAAAFVIFSPEGKILVKEGRSIGQATNNVAEYKAVIFALEWLIEKERADGNDALFFLDSQLVVNQLNGKFKIKDKKLVELVFKIKELARNFSGKIIYRNIPREKNKITDSLVNQTLDNQNLVRGPL